MKWLDALIFGIRDVYSASAALPSRAAVRFHGSGVVATDDPANDRTDIEITSGGAGSDLTPTAVKSAYYEAAIGELVRVDATAGDITILAPLGAAGNTGKRWGVLRVEPTLPVAHTVTISADEGVNDEGSYAMPVARSCAVMVSDGSTWRLETPGLPYSLPSDATPQGIGTAGSAGTSDATARADHVHALGFTAVQSALAGASSSVGFNAQRISAVADPVGDQDVATKAYVTANAGGAGVLHSGSGNPNSARGVQGKSSGGVAVTSTGSVTAGHLLVVLLQCDADITGSTVSDTLGTVYTKIGEVTSGPHDAQVWAGLAGGTGTVTITGTHPSSWARTTFAEYRGMTAGVDDSDAVYGGVGPLSVVAGEAGALIVGAVASYNSGVSYTIASGFEVDATATDGDSSLLVHHVATAAGAASVTYGTNYPDNAPFFAFALTPSAVSSVGVDGDWYLDLTGKVLYGPRTNGVYQRVGALT